MFSAQQLRSAAERCLRESTDANERNTAKSLLGDLDCPGNSPENIIAADQWFNKPTGLLPTFMDRWGNG